MRRTNIKVIYRFSYTLGIILLLLGLIIPMVQKPVMASFEPEMGVGGEIDNWHILEWDRSSLFFRYDGLCQGDCSLIFAEVKNQGAPMQGPTTYEVWYSETGNPMDAPDRELVFTGIIPALPNGGHFVVTYVPTRNGNYKFRAVQREGHPCGGEPICYIWSQTCTIDNCSMPTPTHTPTPTDTPEPTPTFTFTPTLTDTPEPTPTFTFTPTLTDTPEPTPTFTFTPTPTDVVEPTPTFTFTPTATDVVEPTPTFTFTPTATDVVEPTPTFTFTPTPTDVVEPTPTFTFTPTATDVVEPTPTFTNTPIPTDTPEPTSTPNPGPTPTATVVIPTATPADPTATPDPGQTPTVPPNPTDPAVTPTSTVVRTLPPPVVRTPSVLIPVTGADMTEGNPADQISRLLVNLGLAFLGLALTLQAFSKGKNH